jgi:arylsulfatase A-like enzyme
MLAAAGVNYREATTPHPFGPFARAAMLTGVLSPENGVRNYYDPLPQTTRTIAHELNELGYTTAYFGKWHLGRRDPDAALVGEVHAKTIVPEEARGGFLFWEGFESGFLLNDPWLHGSRLAVPRQFLGYQSDVLIERAMDWLGPIRTPWFAVVSLESPHPPYAAKVPAGIARPDPELIKLADNVPLDADVRSRARSELAGYYAHIAATDRAIGRLVEAIDSSTIIVVTSVHGDMHGSHGKFRKGWPYEESVRIPLVVRSAPGGVAGQTVEDPVSLVDLPAMTRCWAAGQSWKCARDRAPLSMPSVVDLPDQCDRIWAGWRSAKRKEVSFENGDPWLCFDLVRDQGEQHNLI